MNKKEIKLLMENREKIEWEYDVDAEDPKKITITIESDRPMDSLNFYDSLHFLLHEIIEPTLFPTGEGKPH